MTAASQGTRDRVHDILEHQLVLVASPDIASSVVQRAIAAAGATSEADRARRASAGPGSGLASIERLVHTRPAGPRVAALLVETATQAVGSTADGPGVAEAAYHVLGAGPYRVAPAAEQGCSRLRAATVANLTRAAWLEARLFLALSRLPHPVWLHALCELVGAVSTGGLIWVLGVLGAYLLRVEGSARALKVGVPIIAATALVAEKPAKAFFAPRRPFAHLVSMMLLGRKPRGQSFPSGHAATAFAAAWTLGAVWPARRPALLGMATVVSLSRVYLGAHDPGEILAGTVLGVGLAEVLRRPTQGLLARVDLPPARRLGRPFHLAAQAEDVTRAT